MWKVGDEVRLNRGWTRMVVIKIKGDQVTAKYDSEAYSVENRVTDWCFENPDLTTKKYTRSASSFTAWDGAPATKVYYSMTKTFRIIAGPYRGQQGTFLNTTSDGAYALELPNGDVRVYTDVNVEEVVPFTFRVKSITNNYRCTYTAPAGATINEGDLLVSESGNVYCVLETNTKDRSTKGEFKGRRLVQETL